MFSHSNDDDAEVSSLCSCVEEAVVQLMSVCVCLWVKQRWLLYRQWSSCFLHWRHFSTWTAPRVPLNLRFLAKSVTKATCSFLKSALLCYIVKQLNFCTGKSSLPPWWVNYRWLRQTVPYRSPWCRQAHAGMGGEILVDLPALSTRHLFWSDNGLLNELHLFSRVQHV